MAFESGISSRVIAGISVAAVAGALFLGFCIYAGLYKRKKAVEASLLLEASPYHYIQHGHGEFFSLYIFQYLCCSRVFLLLHC